MFKKAKKEIGKVTHYFDRIGVAVIKLSEPLAIGDEILFVHGDKEFTQSVASMEIEHEKVRKAKKGDEVAVQVDQKIQGNTTVFKA